MLDVPMFAGQHRVVRRGTLRFWAESGFVRVEDARDNSYKSLSVRQALQHLDALNQMVKRSNRETDYYDELQEQMRFVEEMLDVIRRAQEQGSPDDPTAVRDLARRRAKAIVIPQDCHFPL